MRPPHPTKSPLSSSSVNVFDVLLREPRVDLLTGELLGHAATERPTLTTVRF